MVTADVSVQDTPKFVEPAGAPPGIGYPLEVPLAINVVPAGIPSETWALMATVFELFIQTIVQRRTGKPDSSKVFRPKGGSNKLGVFVGVRVFVGVAVAVFVEVTVAVFVGVPVAVGVGVSVDVLVDVLVGVAVRVAVALLVTVLVGVFVGVLVGVSVGVLVGVSVGVLVAVAVEVLVGVAVGARTVTVSEPVLFVSLPSVTLLLGSTLAVFARLPAAVGETTNVTLNEAPAGSVTAPLAAQAKAVPVMKQLIVPVGGVLPFVTVSAPCG